MTERELALAYAPVIHFDRGETIPLAAVGYSVFRENRRSDSFPQRTIVPEAGGIVIEYALYWDYDIQHMYDLEHIWVHVTVDGRVSRAEGSFHGKYLTLWEPDLTIGRPPEGTHVHAFCQPGKHAFLPDGQLFRLIPGWRACCMEAAGGPVLVGGPFAGAYRSAPDIDRRCERHIREHYAFVPQLDYDEGVVIPAELLQTWERLKAEIPARIEKLCGQLNDD